MNPSDPGLILSWQREMGPNPNLIGTTPVDAVTALVYELLDAHEDTARLARELAVDPRWEAHLGYLRDLQRVGREALAQIAR